VVFSALVTIITRLRRRGSGTAGFAPVSYRAAPGAVAPTTRNAGTSGALRGPGAARVAALVTASAVGTALHVVLVELLLLTGAAESTASTARWWVRGAAVVAIGTYLTVGAVRAPKGPILQSKERIAAAAVGVGVASSVLGAIDMHAFGLYELAGGSSLWDVAFHGWGTAIALLASAWLVVPSRPPASDWIVAQ
jgi:hypothetical protein